MKKLFHVHTFRCGHAEEVPDEEYIERAIELGAEGIWFTDHAPFPGDPFGNRMLYAELPEYIDTLQALKEKYRQQLEVHIGLETEYFPTFDKAGYYRELRENPGLEFLILGQHMAEDVPGRYTYSWDRERLKAEEYLALGEAILQGMESGYFEVVAHPDRIYRRRKGRDDAMAQMAERIIAAARKYDLPLELNEASKQRKNQYWEGFWNLAQGHVKMVRGLDAHSLEELKIL